MLSLASVYGSIRSGATPLADESLRVRHAAVGDPHVDGHVCGLMGQRSVWDTRTEVA